MVSLPTNEVIRLSSKYSTNLSYQKARLITEAVALLHMHMRHINMDHVQVRMMASSQGRI